MRGREALYRDEMREEMRYGMRYGMRDVGNRRATVPDSSVRANCMANTARASGLNWTRNRSGWLFGCWLLVVGCWLLVVGCWLLVRWFVGSLVRWFRAY